MSLSEKARSIILTMQKNETTEAEVYARIARRLPEGENRATLERIAADERRHAAVWQSYTNKATAPDRLKVLWLSLVSRVMGFTFAVKYMENGEDSAAAKYAELLTEVPEAAAIVADEQRHEQSLLAMLDEERLKYVGSMVLGLNDALVELTGTLAGLTFALQNTRLVALSGLITGISATLSMASSEYLSARSDGEEDALKSCVYTGIAYLVTVALLVLPYLLFPAEGYVWALLCMVVIVVGIIAFFNFYIATAKSLPFKRRFLEMAAISLSVAVVSFVIGLLVKRFLGIDL